MTMHSPKLQHCRNLTIRLFNVISRTLVGECLTPLLRSSRCILHTPPTGKYFQCKYKSKLNHYFMSIDFAKLDLLDSSWRHLFDLTNLHTMLIILSVLITTCAKQKVSPPQKKQTNNILCNNLIITTTTKKNTPSNPAELCRRNRQVRFQDSIFDNSNYMNRTFI